MPKGSARDGRQNPGRAVIGPQVPMRHLAAENDMIGHADLDGEGAEVVTHSRIRTYQRQHRVDAVNLANALESEEERVETLLRFVRRDAENELAPQQPRIDRRDELPVVHQPGHVDAIVNGRCARSNGGIERQYGPRVRIRAAHDGIRASKQELPHPALETGRAHGVGQIEPMKRQDHFRSTRQRASCEDELQRGERRIMDIDTHHVVCLQVPANAQEFGNKGNGPFPDCGRHAGRKRSSHSHVRDRSAVFADGRRPRVLPEAFTQILGLYARSLELAIQVENDLIHAPRLRSRAKARRRDTSGYGSLAGLVHASRCPRRFADFAEIQ